MIAPTAWVRHAPSALTASPPGYPAGRGSRAVRRRRGILRRLGSRERRRRRVHRPRAQLSPERPSGRVALEGAPAARDDALGGDALGHPPAVAPVRRPLRPLRRAHRARRLCGARRAERGASHARRARRRSRIRLSRRRQMGAHIRGPAHAPPPPRPRRPPGDGGQDAVLQVQHGAVGARHAAVRRRSARPQAGRRGRCPRLRRRGGRGPHRRRESRDAQRGVGARPVEPRVPRRLERLRHRRFRRIVGRAGHARDMVRRVRVAGHRHDGRQRVGAGDASGARGRAWRQPGPCPVRRVVPHPQGPRVSQVRQQESRLTARDEQRTVLGAAPRVHDKVRHELCRRGRAGSVGPCRDTRAGRRESPTRGSGPR